MQALKDITSPFAALRAQLKSIEPGLEPIDLTIGAPRHQMPGIVKDHLADAIGAFNAYPPIGGTGELISAMTTWLFKRYPALKDQLDETNILPLNGSREGLFYACFEARARRADTKDPVVLMPNPYYQVYSAAALAAGATPYFLNASRKNGFLPDPGAIDPQILNRTIAIYYCSPSNPEGAVANFDQLQDLVKLARSHDFMLFSDECYSELYRNTPPHSALEAAIALDGTLRNCAAFNSLSKRSNVPGLRVGLIAGDINFIGNFRAFRNVAAPQIAGPLQHVAAKLWADEQHVIDNRLKYNQKFELAKSILNGRFEAETPDAGFFLWLNFNKHGGGKNAVTTLWKDCGVKLLPGVYLAQPDRTGQNPATDYARAALVGSLDQTEEALKRIVQRLG